MVGGSAMPAYSSAPATAGTRGNPIVSVSWRPISKSGLMPGCTRRNSLRISRSPYTIDVLLCSAERRQTRRSSLPRSSAKRAVWSAETAPRRMDVRSPRPSDSSSARANPSSSQASNSSPLRAPVMLASTACGRVSVSHLASVRPQTASGRKYLLARPLLELDVDDREEQRLRSAAQQAPVDEPGAAGRACLAAVPALPLEEGQQQVALDERPHVALEQRFPRGPHEQRGRLGDFGRRFRREPGDDGGGGLLQAEPVEGVGGQRQEVRQLADARELRQAEHLDRGQPLERGRGRARPAAPCATGSRRTAPCPLRTRARRRAPCGSAPAGTRSSRGRRR